MFRKNQKKSKSPKVALLLVAAVLFPLLPIDLNFEHGFFGNIANAATYCYIDIDFIPQCFEGEGGGAYVTCQNNEPGVTKKSCEIYDSEQEAQTAAAQVRKVEEDGEPGYDYFGIRSALNDLWITMKVWFWWIPIAISGMLLGAVGKAFDYAVFYTITDFNTLFLTLSSGVDAAWGGLRDVANIVMIAMFVFVAFAVILNIQSYGLKQFGVRILVVALLMNFSLFFTKAIVDVSNVTATQFRNAISVAEKPVISGESTGFTNTITGGEGIAGVFMQRAGLANTWDSLEQLKKQDESDSLVSYSLFTSLFFIGVMSVLLFGLILMVTRIVVLILLMVTSALAFSAHLVPKYGNGWWDKWWGALIKNALFAPLFMMFLWAVLKITEGLSGTEGGGISEIASSGSIGDSFFKLLIIMGLLYGATSIANELSTLGGSYAKKIGIKGFSGGLRALGVGRAVGLAGKLGRGTIGNVGDRFANSDYLKNKAAKGNFAGRFLARGALDASNKAAKASFDFRDNKIAKSLEKVSGGLNLGKGVGGYDKFIDKEAQYIADAKKADTTRGTPAEAAPKVDQTRVFENEEPKATNKTGVDQTRVIASQTQTQPTSAVETPQESQNKSSEGIQSAQGTIERTAAKTREAGRQRTKELETSTYTPSPSASTTTGIGVEATGKRRDPFVEEYRDKRGRFADDRNILRRLINPASRGTTYTRGRIAEKANELLGKTGEEKRLEKIEQQLGDTKSGVDKLGDK